PGWRLSASGPRTTGSSNVLHGTGRRRLRMHGNGHGRNGIDPVEEVGSEVAWLSPRHARVEAADHVVEPRGRLAACEHGRPEAESHAHRPGVAHQRVFAHQAHQQGARRAAVGLAARHVRVGTRRRREEDGQGQDRGEIAARIAPADGGPIDFGRFDHVVSIPSRAGPRRAACVTRRSFGDHMPVTNDRLPRISATPTTMFVVNGSCSSTVPSKAPKAGMRNAVADAVTAEERARSQKYRPKPTTVPNTVSPASAPNAAALGSPAGAVAIMAGNNRIAAAPQLPTVSDKVSADARRRLA